MRTRATAARARPRRVTQRVRVLLQDPDASRNERLRAHLARQRGWSPTCVATVDEAVYALEAGAVDVVVCRVPPGGAADVLAHASAHHPQALRVALCDGDDPARALPALRHAHRCLSGRARDEDVTLVLRQATRVRALLTDDTLRTLVLGLEVLPSVPLVLQHLLGELRGLSPSVARVGALVEEDPASTAELLRVVNSPLLGLRQSVTDAALAVTLLGLETVGAVLVQQQWLSRSDGRLLDRVGLGTLFPHSLRTARRAASVGRHFGCGHEDIGTARAAGLLHDIGKLVLAVNFPDRYRQAWTLAATGEVPLRVSETLFVGAPHDWVGGHLLALWGLPDPIVEAVAFHHDPRHGGTTTGVALGLVHLANRLDHARDSAAPHELDTDYLAAIGCTVDTARWTQWLEEDA